MLPSAGASSGFIITKLLQMFGDLETTMGGVNNVGLMLWRSHTSADCKAEPFGNRRQRRASSAWTATSAIHIFWISVVVPPNEGRETEG